MILKSLLYPRHNENKQICMNWFKVDTFNSHIFAVFNMLRNSRQSTINAGNSTCNKMNPTCCAECWYTNDAGFVIEWSVLTLVVNPNYTRFVNGILA